MKVLTYILVVAIAIAGLACSKPQSITVDQAKKAFEKQPLTGWIEYDSNTDPNEKIGRPNGYVSKASWFDSRLERKSDVPDCTIEIFANVEDLILRKQQIEQVYKATPTLSTYVFVHRNVMLRLPETLKPDQAAEYEAALKSL